MVEKKDNGTTFDFETLVDRKGIGNLKETLSSDAARKAGLVNYRGAEMDFKTAPSVIRAMTERVQNGLFGFTLSDETYLKAVQWWMKTQRGYEIDRDWIVPTYGTIFSVATAIRMTTATGEGIIVQPPVYNRFEQAATRLARKTVYNQLVNTNSVYSIDFENLAHLMADSNNKLMILCNPHNPIGKVWGIDDLTHIAELANRYGVTVFSDEIFAEITFDGHMCVPYAAIPEAAKHAITSTSLGKSFNFTGINHANMIIPDPALRSAFEKQRDVDHYGSLDPIVHAATLGAYCEEGAQWERAMIEHIAGNITCIRKFFEQHLPQVRISPSEGSFVMWIDWRSLGLDSGELHQFIAEEAHLDLDPGEHYGCQHGGFTRMSVATTRQMLQKTLDVLLKAATARGFAR